MAGRILDRRRLREQAEGGEQESETSLDTANLAVLPKKNVKMKEPKAPKVKQPRSKKAPPLLFARWGVFDKSMIQVAIFDYNQRADAEEKVTELNAKAKGDHFLQIVKEPMPELASAIAPGIK